MIRDWLPFALGTAITAGVAPLLFIQVLYMKPFYTANLLLFHRWMAIVPVLILAFTLLYLLKSPRLQTSGPVKTAFVSIVVLACFLFVALSWTENHLLSLDSAAWPKLYESHAMRYPHPLIPLRLAMWIAAAVPLFCTLMGWQAFAAVRRGVHLPAGEVRLLPWLALGGIATAMFCAWRYTAASGYAPRDLLWGHFTGMHFLLGIFGVILQSIAWISVVRMRSINKVALVAASFGAGFAMMGAMVCRERLRLGALDLEALHHRLAKLGMASGLPVFVVCLVITAAMIAWCVCLAMRSQPSDSAPASGSQAT
jgi:hypothetical protein